MKRLLSSLSFASILCFSTAALADEDVVVVDVVSESLDAEAVRASIAKELGKPVVAPEDARAQAAKGWLTVEPRDGKLTVTYRPLGALVARTVDLPDDATRARRLAALLAGNVARDEASELADSLKKKPEPPLPPPALPAPDTSVSQLRFVLERGREADRKARISHAWVSSAIGVAALAPSIYFLTSTGDSERLERSFGSFLLSTSIVYTTQAIVGFAGVGRNEHDELIERLDQEVASGASPAEVTARVEEAWKTKSESARAMREGSSIVLGAVGALGVGAGVVVPLLSKESRGTPAMYTFSEISIGVGAFLLTMAPIFYFTESRSETAFHTYETMAHGRASAPPSYGFRPQKLRAGVAPVPGGGMASVGFVF